MKSSISFPRVMTLGLLSLIGRTLVVATAADPSDYFSSLSSDEKEDYTTWLTDHSSSYSRHEFMPSAASSDSTSAYEDGAAIFWTIDSDTQTIQLALAVRATGWAGFGISEAGGMIGSDMALFEASSPNELIDAHVVDDQAMPLTDTTCQDWALKSTSSPIAGENGWIIVEVSRLLDTHDTQDHALKDDSAISTPPTRLIAAWGDDSAVSYHGENKARSSVRLFATDSTMLEEILSEASDGYFDVLQDMYEIPSNETTYYELCKTFSELSGALPEGTSNVTMIGVMPIVDQVSAVHHFVVYLLSECNFTNATFQTGTLMYAWAPGDQGFALPMDVGFPLFDNENNQAIYIDIHYNNPAQSAGMLDSSGLRFYYVNEERTHRAGVYQTGDPFVGLLGEEINDGLTQHTFTCPGECSGLFLGSEMERTGGDASAVGVTVFTELLHMHQTGVRMTNEVIRNGEVFHTAAVDVYDFEQQGLFTVPQEPYTFLPGDSVRTTCYYNDGTAWGLGSAEEMCIAFMFYYPVKKLPSGMDWVCNYGFDLGTGCMTELEQVDLSDVEDLGRSFGSTSDDCTASTTVAPPPTAETPTSGTGWLGVTSIVPMLAVLSVMMMMMIMLL